MWNARALEALLLIFALGSLRAVESSLPQARLSWECEALDALQALSAISKLNDSDQDLAEGDLDGLGRAKLSFRLVEASAAGQRQAIAHALGCWWAVADHEHERQRVIYSRLPKLPAAQIHARTHTSTLAQNPGLEGVVTCLMQPWLDMPDAGLSYLASDGLWHASLASEGHARLLEVLTLLERPEPQCPSHIPDADEPDERLMLSTTIRASSFKELASKISRDLAISVSLSQTLAERAIPGNEILIEPAPLRSVRDQLARKKVISASIHGVLCLDTQPIFDRESPGERRRLALLPIGNLVSQAIDADLLAATLKRRIAPGQWDLPGWGIFSVASCRSLLVAADPSTISSVLDALDRVDALGIDAAFASDSP